MFLPEPNVRIWLYTQPVDMRKSFDGLSALVVSQLQDDPASGQLFVFINRRKTHLKGNRSFHHVVANSTNYLT
ncbi:IS66 family insertion sequence element accessory protein TnpB [Ketobacter sp. MCCC 1A13808]|uniref:IS66 family insertion sequence element accessory protein TnpB n=1 Tax=Ketobacter sp. MCCC 1A13808 TaxID=2602738 RepID=UPI0012EC3775|nr:IS66 family insertion sequence element accessory protein TnpB [Ketobacter sp. MCCC 1A13808]MVF14449.1 IS66 family insertion sequence element accessory protein TnpB [Ketobacter sp. MCCC 1A13808]